MKYLYVPQRNDNVLLYNFKDDEITVTLQEVTESTTTMDEAGNPVEQPGTIKETTEVFDFTGMPDGEATEIVAETLPVNPVLKAKRINGTLEVELLYYHGKDATEEERFPTWKEVI